VAAWPSKRVGRERGHLAIEEALELPGEHVDLVESILARNLRARPHQVIDAERIDTIWREKIALSAEDTQHLVASHDEGIRYTDAQLGGLLRDMDEHDDPIGTSSCESQPSSREASE